MNPRQRQLPFENPRIDRARQLGLNTDIQRELIAARARAAQIIYPNCIIAILRQDDSQLRIEPTRAT